MKYTEIADIISGGTPKTSEPSYWNGSIPWLSVVDFNSENKYVYSTEKTITQEGLEKSSTKLLQPDDIIISARGTVGAMAMIPFPMAFNQSCFGLRAKKKVVDPHYLYYATKCKVIELKTKSKTGNVFKSINLDTFDILSINLPPMQEQKKIASVLSAIDKKIEINQQINRNLEELARLIYDYWFVQFDFPDKNGKPYKSSGGKMMWNEALKREIPNGWSFGKIKELEPEIVTGKTPSTLVEDNFGGEIPFITIDDIRQAKYINNTERTLTEKGADSQKTKYIPANSLCCSCIGTVGVIGFNELISQTNQQINTIVIHNESHREYLYFALKNYFEKTSVKTGNVFSNMNKEEFSSIRILFPSNELLDKFNSVTSVFFKKQRSICKENQTLRELRDFLLPLLMNGQVSLRS